MKTLAVDQTVIENVIKYCEDKQVYDKLGAYGDFYYKLKMKLAGQSIADNLNEHSKQFEGKELIEPELKTAMVKSGAFKEVKEDWLIRIIYPVDSGYFVSEAKGILTTTEKPENATTFTREDADDICEGLNGSREEWFDVVHI